MGTWAQQIKDAMVVNGGDIESASTADYVMHFLTFGFKLIFAIIPPPGLLGGYPCFIISLIFIGLIVVLVGDLASIFGCLIGLRDEVTAITFVALGTSLPDTFASKAAALGDEYADASVGNVTGSNSVNVFLGLGLPWMIGSIYWVSEGEKGLKVASGNLGFSVAVFSSIACATIGLLGVRRMTVGAELGGPAGFKWFTSGFLVFLWLIYIGLSSWE